MSSGPTSSPPARSGLGAVYANLLDPGASSSASISRAPVVFNTGQSETSQEESTARKQPISSAALRFQPTKRPQLPTQKPKTKPAFPKPPAGHINAPNQASLEANNISTLQPGTRTTIADWTNDDEDVNGFYGSEKRQRAGRKKRKKNNAGNKEETTIPQDWDDIYDPSRPNNYEEYKNSDEKIREIRDWKDVLYAHRMRKRRGDTSDGSDDGGRPTMMRNQFAPPAAYSFAPPPPAEETASFSPSPPPPPPVDIPDDPTGEDAYMRRLRLSQLQSGQHPPEPAVSNPTPPPPPPSHVNSEATISRAPVRYNLPSAPADIPSEAEFGAAIESNHEQQPFNDDHSQGKEEEPRSLRPGQKGFAERLMSKYGWTKGTGLGANNSGIINPLRVQVDKSKKKVTTHTGFDPDGDGGGTKSTKTSIAGRGKIIGGNKKKAKKGDADENDDEEGGMFGKMSEVVMLQGMVDNMDLDQEMLGGDGDEGGENGDGGGLMQEIGEECSEKYGRVERVFIYRGNGDGGDVNEPPLPSSGEKRSGRGGPRVFVKFTSQLSALRAVNALQGRIFNGNTISARFYDVEKFEDGVYS